MLEDVNKFMKECNEPMICHCGGIDHQHVINDDGCFREPAPEAPVLSDKTYLGENMWTVHGIQITDYTLKHQRLYHQHECGCWSRSKDGSTNSIEMDD